MWGLVEKTYFLYIVVMWKKNIKDISLILNIEFA